MTSYEDALSLILSECRPLGHETVEVGHLFGRTLSEQTISPIDVPGFDNSAVDGYGIHAEDSLLPLRIVGTLPAGRDPQSVVVGRGEAIRIFTGSAIPPGVDTVVMQEDVAAEGDRVTIIDRVTEGQFIRRKGSEISRGQSVVQGQTFVSPPILSLLASLGLTSAPAYVRPKVCIVATGSELIAPGNALAEGQIYESITPGLASGVRAAGSEVLSIHHTVDDSRGTERLLATALKDDVVITCGGVSVGDFDLVKPSFAKLGVETRVWQVSIRPGKPFYFGVGPNGQKVFGLPGNPVSALVTFLLFVRPALLQMVGRSGHSSIAIPMARAWPEIGNRDDFVRSKIVDGKADPDFAQESYMLSGLARADLLIRFPAHSGPYRAGDVVQAIPITW